jgi:hypothetical protein
MCQNMNLPDTKSIQPKEPDDRLPYRLREQFMSTPELALFRTLQEMVGRRYVICPKVGLNDIFYIVRPNENVHFFLCDPNTFKPAIGVELVKPVAKNETREADQFMQDLFLSAGIPLVHIPSSERYVQHDVAELFQLAVLKVKDSAPLRATTKSDSVPMCPVCGRMMVLRIHRDGPNNGKKFYGCMDSPKCNGVVMID